MTLTQDRLRALIDVLVESVDDPARGEALAQRAHFSRFHFDRLVRAAKGESPAVFRRRLLLERAAHELAHGESVVGAAIRTLARSFTSEIDTFRALSREPLSRRPAFSRPGSDPHIREGEDRHNHAPSRPPRGVGRYPRD